MRSLLGKYGSFIFLLLAFSAVYVASWNGLFINSQNQIDQYRAKLNSIDATGDFVFVGIDKRSLDDVGVWPWPRSIYAQVIDRLIEYKVAETGFDIDFSAYSTPTEDTILSESLEKAGGSVVLPLFVQHRSAASDDNSLDVNKPVEEFEQHAWLASVNVIPDADGVVRRFPFGVSLDGDFIDSMPATLSGVFGQLNSTININFSIDPKSIPSISVKDLLAGDLEPELLDGKIVLIGAIAVELRDNFAVPVHGIVPGAIVQLLAAETLKQDLQVTQINPVVLLLLFGICVLTLTLGRLFIQRSSFLLEVGTLIAASISIEIAGLFLFKEYALRLPSVELHVLLILMLAFGTFKHLDLQNWLIKLIKSDLNNTQQMLDQVVSDNASGILVVNEVGKILTINKQFSVYFDLSELDESDSVFCNILPKLLEDEIRGAIVALKLNNIHDHRKGVVEHSTTGKIDSKQTFQYTVTASKINNYEGADQVETYIACVTAWDITTKLAQEKRIAYHAKYDELTGAFRRSEFHALIIDKLNDPKPDDCVVVFAINLHRFKTINVTLGRDIGDEVLKSVKGRIDKSFSGASDIARCGGDTFLVTLSGDLSHVEIKMLADHMISIINEPFTIVKSTITVGLRVGAASSSDLQYSSASQLIENAEVALDEACKTSGNGFVMYEEVFTAVQDFARTVESDLWHSLDRNEIKVFYQPQVDLSGSVALI